MIVLATTRVESPLADSLIERWTTSADKAHAATRRSQTARSLSLMARAGLRALLLQHTAQSEWVFCADTRGKLSIMDGAGHAGPAVCVAHTRGMVACALGDVFAVGVDIEAYRPRDFNAIAAWSFGPLECAAVAAGDAAAFYRIWTLREALGKATGEGLALATDRRDRTEDGPNTGTWGKLIDRQNWLLGHFRPDRHISIAVAALLGDGEAPGALDVRWIDISKL